MDASSSQWSTQSPEQSCELYIRDYPHRSIAIVSATHALILRYSSTATEFNANGSQVSLPSTRSHGHGNVTAAKCMVEFSPLSQELLRDYRPLTSRPIYGTLGLISINSDVFLSVINHAARAATVRPGETVERILSVSFYCLSSADYDDVVPLDSLDPDLSDGSSIHSRDGPYAQGLGRRDIPTEHHPCHDLRKILSNGSFYYSTDFDVTTRLQERPVNSNSFQIDDFDDTYLWNSYMISPLVQFRSRLMPQEQAALDKSRILTSAIRGFCKTMTIPQSGSPLKGNTGRASLLTLISRLSCRRAGTRFNARGIDDDGHVANFVESETVFWSPSGTVFSYAQVRGSIPVFWEQAADLIPGRQKITLTRSPDATQPTFNKHFEELEREYGAVHIINLLSNTKPGEVELGGAYKIGIRNCPLSQPSPGGSADNVLLRETHYDFHAETKGPAGYEAARDIRRYIEHSTDSFAYYLADEADDAHRHDEKGGVSRLIVVLQQEGVFRTNCLDCLDRTNLIQTMISQMAMETFLEHRGARASPDFWMRHSTLWADNGDSLSKIYAGTGALKTSFTRSGKMSLAGAVADMRKSVQRIYHNNFVDPSRQHTIDMLLGRLIGQAPVDLFDPISDYVSAELNKRSQEFTKIESISIWAGTFNLNGKTEGLNHDLSPWLFPPAVKPQQLPDIYVVAFQEIVELSPQQIMNSDPSRKYLWEQAVQRTLNQRQSDLGGEHYVLLRSGQLVGAALCIFVKASALPSIKNVEGSVKKTGLSGMAGNKGAVAIRLDYANTQICFVTAHLAAGFGNYDERNRDYTTIHEGLRFQRDRGIDNHDTVIWLGDFNYRIGLGSDAAKNFIRNGDLGSLYENDQLNLQMVAGLAFQHYSENRITFMPTYKFDVGSDTYDSSEKARIPAWTDRVLRKGTNLRQLAYDSAPLRFSDHRPVYATFDCDVSIVDQGRRAKISQELYLRRKHEIGDTTAHIGDGNETDDEDLIGYDAIEPGLPPASSDRQKWWLDGGQPARAQVASSNGHNGHMTMLNPNRPSNPFGKTTEPDWVKISRASPASTTSASSYGQSTRSKTVTSANSSRRLPPTYDPDALPAKVGPMKNNGGDTIQRKAVPDGTEPPPPPPPRRSGTASSQAIGTQPLAYRPGSSASSHASSISQQTKDGKAPPPIARKPAYLSTSAANSPVAATSSQGLPDVNNTTPALPRRPVANTANVDLLGGLDESGQVGEWQSLQPSTK